MTFRLQHTSSNSCRQAVPCTAIRRFPRWLFPKLYSVAFNHSSSATGWRPAAVHPGRAPAVLLLLLPRRRQQQRHEPRTRPRQQRRLRAHRLPAPPPAPQPRRRHPRRPAPAAPGLPRRRVPPPARAARLGPRLGRRPAAGGGGAVARLPDGRPQRHGVLLRPAGRGAEEVRGGKRGRRTSRQNMGCWG